MRGSALLALRRRAGGKTERRGDRDPPALGRLNEKPFRDAAGCGVFLCDRVAVRPIDHARPYRKHAQIPGDESVGPGRVASRAPRLISEVEARRSVARQSVGVKIGGEITSTVTLMYRVDV